LKYFVINAKNYPEVAGPGLQRLVSAIHSVSTDDSFKLVRFFLAPPNFGLASSFRLDSPHQILSQHLDDAFPGAFTGFSVPEIARSFGAVGSILNHSEHRLSETEIESLVSRLRKLEMLSLVCAKDDLEVGKFAKFNPDFIAVEPPELIGSGKAVSKERPEIIQGSRSALEKNRLSYSFTKLLCGAGIADGIDARTSVELGAEGILVASGVIKAQDIEKKIRELAQGLIDGEKRGAD
jgi:triosephosphate isomerase (TIM)